MCIRDRYYTASAANHDSVSGSFEIEIKNASITGVDAAGYTGIYDGQSHGIKITLNGNAGDGEILYGESEDNCTLTESPVYKNTGSYTCLLYTSILPAKVTAVVNSRILTGDTVESVKKHLEDIVPEEVEVRVLKGSNASPTSLYDLSRIHI